MKPNEINSATSGMTPAQKANWMAANHAALLEMMDTQHSMARSESHSTNTHMSPVPEPSGLSSSQEKIQ